MADAAVRSLEELTTPELADARRAGWILAVPLGSTEQHGPHLPLSTDTIVATELCRLLAEARSDVVVGPAVPIGSSGEHQAFAGTLSIGQDALESVVVELCRSATETFDHVVLVSGHGGNAVALRRAAGVLRKESRDVHLHLPRVEGDLHAGRTETSLMLALRPDLVRPEPVVGDTRPLAEIWPELRTGGVAAVSPSGVLGDPTHASAREGRALLDAMTAELVASVNGWRAAGR